MSEIAAQVEPYVPALRRYAWALLQNDQAADDLVQDCLERAVTRWPLRRHDGDLRAWLFAIQRNLYIDGIGYQANRGARAKSVETRNILSALAALPEDQISILLLVSVEGLSYEEVAQVMQVPAGRVMSRLGQAREAVRHVMDSGHSTVLRSVK